MIMRNWKHTQCEPKEILYIEVKNHLPIGNIYSLFREGWRLAISCELAIRSYVNWYKTDAGQLCVCVTCVHIIGLYPRI